MDESTQFMTVRVPPALMVRIDQARQGMQITPSRSQMIRFLLDAALRTIEKDTLRQRRKAS